MHNPDFYGKLIDNAINRINSMSLKDLNKDDAALFVSIAAIVIAEYDILCDSEKAVQPTVPE